MHFKRMEQRMEECNTIYYWNELLKHPVEIRVLQNLKKLRRRGP